MTTNIFGAQDKVSKDGDSMSGPLVLNGSPPMQVPAGAVQGYVWTSDAEGDGSWQASAMLTPTGVKTTAYTASPGDWVPVDASGGSVVITLPASAADKARVGMKMVKTAGSNTATLTAPAGVTFNDDASTTAVMKLLNQGVIAQFARAAAVWYVQSDDLPLSQLDARYAQLAGATFTGPLASDEAITSGVVVLAYSSTIAVNAQLGGHFRVTLGGSPTISNPTNPTDGQKITFELIQDSTGSRSVTWGTAYNFGRGSPPTLTTTAGKRDLVGFVYSASESDWLYAGAGIGGY